MELERSVYQELIKWKKNKNSKAILLKGVRQCGKTYIVRKFAKEQYEFFIEINFITDKNAITIFNGDLDSKTILTNISALKLNSAIIPNKTLVFLDEIQECPRAIAALKFLAEDKEIDYVASGSLLCLTYKNVPSFPTGYIKEITMYPLSFKEFAIASGLSDKVLNHVRECFIDLKAVNTTVNDSLLSLFRTYLIVGGMPDAVSSFLESRNFDDVIEIQKELYNEYNHDIIKYAEKSKEKIRDIYQRVPSVLSSGGRRFLLSEINSNARYERYESGFRWLYDSGTVLPCFNVKEPMIPLGINAERNLQKLFLSDIGILSALTIKGAQLDILSGEINANLGYLFENVVAQELVSCGYDLYYYNQKTIGEIDFIIQDGMDVIPIEVKSGKDYKKHNALNKLISVSNYKIKKSYVLCHSNIEKTDNIIYLPWYMTAFMERTKIDKPIAIQNLENLDSYLD